MIETIRCAQTAADYAAFARLIREYVDWGRERYRDQAWFVDKVFGHQSLEQELQALGRAYGPPEGATLLAVSADEVRGAGAWRRLSGEICEMKRVFVPIRFQGQGLGRRLCQALMDEAGAAGYRGDRPLSLARISRVPAVSRVPERPARPHPFHGGRTCPTVRTGDCSVCQTLRQVQTQPWRCREGFRGRLLARFLERDSSHHD